MMMTVLIHATYKWIHPRARYTLRIVPDDMKYGTLKRPAKTLDFNSGSVFPSKGRVPQTKIYKTTPMLYNAKDKAAIKAITK